MLSAFFAFLIFFIFLLIAGSQALRPCEQMHGAPNFEPDKFLGIWYRYSAYPANPAVICRQYVCTWTDNSGVMKFQTNKMANMTSGRPTKEKVHLFKYNGDAGYNVIRPTGDPFFHKIITVWNTDYTTYAIKGTCETVNNQSVYSAWILTRDAHAPPSVIAQINKVIKDDGFPDGFFKAVDQLICPIPTKEDEARPYF